VRLQWGHDFSTVEIPLRPEGDRSVGWASMGPRFFNRGNVGKASDSLNDLAELQWGHDFSTVEIPSRKEWPSRLHQRASMGPRFFNRGNLRPMGGDQAPAGGVLQWGHDFSTVEISRWGAPLLAGVAAASMGPRFFNRGNVAHFWPLHFFGTLQWGHDFSTVEISIWIYGF